ncbi:MAG: type II toxin-antitoxin system HicB family antitoxin [Planctomycetota bacterium]
MNERKTHKHYTVQVIVEQDEDGFYVVSCPGLPACYTQGRTFEEAIERIKDVIKMCLEEILEKKKSFRFYQPDFIALKKVVVSL